MDGDCVAFDQKLVVVVGPAVDQEGVLLEQQVVGLPVEKPFSVLVGEGQLGLEVHQLLAIVDHFHLAA